MNLYFVIITILMGATALGLLHSENGDKLVVPVGVVAIIMFILSFFIV